MSPGAHVYWARNCEWLMDYYARTGREEDVRRAWGNATIEWLGATIALLRWGLS